MTTLRVLTGINCRGLCACGCGTPTRISDRTDRQRGVVRGQPLKFVNGHNNRGNRRPDRYVERDCGYTSPCWVWQLGIDADGYGRDSLDGKSRLAHRLSYERHIGPIPDGLDLDHLCRNHPCINPAHLEPVAPAENTRRGSLAKLTWEAARHIRESSATAYELAEHYGVHPTQIYRVRNGSRWVPASAS